MQYDCTHIYKNIEMSHIRNDAQQLPVLKSLHLI